MSFSERGQGKWSHISDINKPPLSFILWITCFVCRTTLFKMRWFNRSDSHLYIHWPMCWLLQVISPFHIYFISLNKVNRLDLKVSIKPFMGIPQRYLGIRIESDWASVIYLPLTPILTPIQQKTPLLCIYRRHLFFFFWEMGPTNTF